MTKNDFLNELRKGLRGLSKDDIEERVSFYSEMIDDMVEDGKTEEEAIGEIGSVDDVIRTIAGDVPLGKLVKERIKPKRTLTPGIIILIILGFPLWLPLLITAFVLILVACILSWVLVIVAFSVWLSVVTFAIMSLGIYIKGIMGGDQLLMYLAMSLVSFGLLVPLFMGALALAKFNIKLNKKMLLSFKTMLIRGENRNE